MPQETNLQRKLRELGLSQDSPNTTTAKKLTFRVYFPRPPYGPVEYTAAKQGDGLNFVGQLLGHGGCTLKRIQTESGTRVEVHDSKGNLNGTHPSYADPSLHAVVFAENREKLNKAVRMIAEVLQPVDASFEKFEVAPGKWALLKPAIPKKEKSPRSETSSQGIWGGASSPSSETGSVVNPVDIDSAYVPTSHPWRNVKHLNVTKPPKPCSEKTHRNKADKENTLCGMPAWNTWGHNKSDKYCQFTAMTQNLVLQYAQRSRAQRKSQWEQRTYTENPPEPIPYFETSWSPTGGKLNGSNVNSNFSQFLPSEGTGSIRDRELKPNGLEGFPLPHVYEELIGPNESERGVSRLTSAYHITAASGVQAYNQSSSHTALPHNI